MTTNELKVLEIIWNWGGEASINTISRETKISIEYVRLICESLGRQDYIDFLHPKLCKIKSKGNLMMAGRKSRPKKIIISQNSSEFGLNKDNEGRLRLEY